MNKQRKKDILTYSIMLGLGLLFYFLPGKWISIESDSPSYLTWEKREGVLAGYPAFLYFFESLFTEKYFLHIVVIVQSLLALVCTFLFVYLLQKEFHLKRVETIFLYILTMLPFSIYLPEVGITHQIMTEGITYSLFYLFFIAVIKTVWTVQYRWYWGSVAIATLLGVIRTQMLFLQILCILLLIWISVKRLGKKNVGIIAGLMAFLIAGMLFQFGDRIQIPSQFNTVLVARGFYEADQEDLDLFEDDMMREIFMKTYQMADEEGHLYQHAEPGLYMWRDLVYDKMRLYVAEAIEEYDMENPGLRERGREDIVRELGIRILINHFDRYLYHSTRLMISSFIASVFFQIEPIYLLCHFIALFLYLFAIAVCFTVKRLKGDKRVFELGVVTLGTLVIMVITVNLLFMGLQRYVVYGMGIFYCTMYLLCREIIKRRLTIIYNRNTEWKRN